MLNPVCLGLVRVTIFFVLALLGSEPLPAQTPLPARVTYDIVYIRAPRQGDDQITRMPEIKDPINVEPGSDLVLLHPDGTEEVLVAGGKGAVLDPAISFDGQWVFFAKVHDQTQINTQRRGAITRQGADLFKLHLPTRQLVQLTFQEWTPNTGVGNWSTDHLTANPPGTNYLGYGIYNLGPSPLPNGKLIFTSSRNGFLPNKPFTFPNLQLFVMDQDGRNVELIGHLNLGSALHPTVLTDGRVMFSSYEAQGLRDRRLWGLWAIWPDGRNWAPLMSAMKSPNAFHWQTQLSDGSLVVTEYYNQNNNGFGTFLHFPSSIPSGAIAFGSPAPNDPSNPPVRTGWFSNGKIQTTRYPFSPFGIQSLTPFTHGNDRAAPFFQGTGPERTGKVTQPSGAPNNDVLLVWSPGPANHLNRPTNRPAYDAGLYLLAGEVPVVDPQHLILLKNDPAFNEQQPRAVVPYRDIYGIDEPAALPWLPNDGTEHAELPPGTPYGLVGTSTFYRRDSKPGLGSAEFNGLDPFNTTQNGASSNWSAQGADAGLYDNRDIFAVRIVALEPTSHLSYGPNSRNDSSSNWQNHANERMRILGEIPLKKVDANGQVVLDPDGNPDTSFLAKIPADVPFTFQTIDKDGMVLNMAQTWHQVRPGEARYDCGGCHAHSQHPLDFEQTAAARPDYQILDLANTTPLLSKDTDSHTIVTTIPQGAVDVEYYRDIKPILQRSCVPCHSQSGRQEAGLVLDDEELVGGYDGTYHRLANDSGAQYGIPPLVKVGTNPVWRQTNASRYIRKLQARRSLLIWKILGRRTDGWTNDDHPSAAVPGDASTLPGGGDKNEINRSDLDYTGTIMPPPHSGIPPLTENEKMVFVRWIDLGAPISQPGRDSVGWFADESRPTLTLSSPRAGVLSTPLTAIQVGIHDYYSGLDMASMTVTANFAVNGAASGTNIAGRFQPVGDHIWALPLSDPLTTLDEGVITVSIKDRQGNLNTLSRTFSIAPGEPPPVNHPPTAVMVSDVTTGRAPLTIHVDGSSSSDSEGPIASFTWDFGDGQFAFTPTSSHVFSLAGEYTIILTVHDQQGASDFTSLTITVTPPSSDTTPPANPKNLRITQSVPTLLLS